MQNETSTAATSHTADAIYNSVPTAANEPAIQAEGNFGVTNAPSDQDSTNPSDNTYMSAPAATDDAQASDSAPATTNPLAPSASDSPLMAKFKLTVLAALGNTDFTGDPKKVEKATQAVTLPNPEDRVRAQLQVHAKKTLYAKAAEDAERGLPFVLPTKADIDSYVEKGVQAWKAKQPQQQ